MSDSIVDNKIVTDESYACSRPEEEARLKALDFAAAFMKTLSQGVPKGRDDEKLIQQRKDRKRQINRASAKRKRMRAKQELEDIATQCKQLETINQQLKADNLRLAGVIREEFLKQGMLAAHIEHLKANLPEDHVHCTSQDGNLRDDNLKGGSTQDGKEDEAKQPSKRPTRPTSTIGSATITPGDPTATINTIGDPLYGAESCAMDPNLVQNIISSLISTGQLLQEYVQTPQGQQQEESEQQHLQAQEQTNALSSASASSQTGDMGTVALASGDAISATNQPQTFLSALNSAASLPSSNATAGDVHASDVQLAGVNTTHVDDSSSLQNLLHVLQPGDGGTVLPASGDVGPTTSQLHAFLMTLASIPSSPTTAGDFHDMSASDLAGVSTTHADDSSSLQTLLQALVSPCTTSSLGMGQSQHQTSSTATQPTSD